MVPRQLRDTLLRDARGMPVITLVGPRQSGKSTLVRGAFPDHAYVNLERPDLRDAARDDPRSLIHQPDGPVILDEVQHVPELLSWIQVAVDERPSPGRFVLTGSNQHALSAAVSQTLAGRTSVSTLLPPDLRELRGFPAPPGNLWSMLWAGSYPRIHDAGLDPSRWLEGYAQTYVERDVRQLLRVGDLTTFRTFLRLVAARTSAELNLSKLGADAGVTQPTAKAWLSLLEASFLVFSLPAWHRNTRKQLIKRPKVHLVDTGLVASLLGTRRPDELFTHPLRGALFETWVALELRKQRLHAGRRPHLFHWRESRGVEVDVVVDDGDVLWLVEAKSGATVARDWFDPLVEARALAQAQHPHKDVRPVILYGGEDRSRRQGVEVVPWSQIDDLAPPA